MAVDFGATGAFVVFGSGLPTASRPAFLKIAQKRLAD
jgi:hypothetical protein